MRHLPHLCSRTVVAVTPQRLRPTKRLPLKSLRRRVFILVCLLEVLSVASYAAGECATVNFRLPRSVTAGANPQALAVQDFNGDGHIDLAVANSMSNDVSILLGNGAGGLGAATNYPVGDSPSSIATGDFNGDGKADLATTNFFSYNVSILLGAGAGTFSPGGTINISSAPGPRGLAVGDFNGDGRSDIALGVVGQIEQSGSVSILLGRSTGGFTSAPLISPGGSAYRIIAGKFNNDNILDLAFGMGTKSAVFIGDGTGGFSAASPLPNSFSVDASGDFNNDGKADLVGRDRNTPGISMLLGDGAGGFSAQTVFPANTLGREMEVGDFNGDGKIDVAVLDYDAGVSILPGDGTGQLGAATGYSLPDAGDDIVSADFNADGKLDLAVAINLGNISLFYGRADGNLTGAFKFTVGDYPGRIAVADFNLDGKEDLAVTILNYVENDFLGYGISILLGDGAGRMGPAVPLYFSGSVTSLYSLVAADFNGDGKADLAFLATESSRGSRVNVMPGRGDGTFAPRIATGLSSYGNTPHTLLTADVNRDSKADLFVRFANPDGFATLLGTSTGTFNIQPGAGLGSSSNSGDYAVGDFNQDANPDLVFLRSLDKQLVVLLGEGDGLFSTKIDLQLPDHPLAVAIEDFNRDGKADLAITSASPTATPGISKYHVSVRLNNGVGGFGDPTNYQLIGSPDGIITKDFNGDNFIDLVITDRTQGKGIWVLSGDSEGGLGLPVPLLFGNVNSATAADFNGDGKMDLAASRPGRVDGVALLLSEAGTPQPCLSVSDATPVVEGDAGTTNAAFHVTLSAASAQTVQVNYSVEPYPTSLNFNRISPTPGVDYQLTSGTLTFAPGTTSQTINVPINGDLTDDYDEVIALVISSPTNAAIQDSYGLGTILDNDAPPTITIDDRTVVEGNSSSNPNTAVFTVSLSAASDKEIFLNYQLANGTAKMSSDYRDMGRPLRFTPGTTTQTIVIQSLADSEYEADETFFVNLTNVSNATITDAQGQGTIINDDAPPSISISSLSTNEGDTGSTDASVTVQLSSVSYQPITVNYSTADGTASAGSDYGAVSGTLTFNPGELSKLIKVPVVGDKIVENDETFGITLSGAVNATLVTAQAIVTIMDNDEVSISINDISVVEGDEGTKIATFTVALSEASRNLVSVNYMNHFSSTASDGLDFRLTTGSVTIAPGQLSSSVQVEILGDTDVEPDETLVVLLFAPTGGTISDFSGTCTILNDDNAGTLQFSAASYSVNENADAVITVTRVGGDKGTISAEVNAYGGTALMGSDYNVNFMGVVFTHGDTTSKTYVIPIIDDARVESPETINLSFSNPTYGAILGSPSTAVLTILDNDSACSYAIDPTSKTSPAAGETTSVNVTTQAECNWTAASNSNFISVTSGASGSGNGVVTLNVSANGSGAPRTGSVTIAGHTFIITQPEVVPEVPTVQFGAPSYAVGEGEGRVVVTVTRTGDVAGAASVDYRTLDTDAFTFSCADTTNNGGAFARCDFATTVGRLDFAPGEAQKTITIPVINDGHDEEVETFQIVLSNPVGVAVPGNASAATVTIEDNDGAGTSNPIITLSPADYPFFVRQQYLDFLSREPEAGEPWTAVMNRCRNVNTPPATVTDCDRIAVSGAFFGSPEYRIKGFYVFRFYKVAFNRLPEYREIVVDMSFVAGATEAQVYARRAQLATAFAALPEFTNAYSLKTNEEYVATLLARYQLGAVTTPDPAAPDGAAKVTLSSAALVNGLNTGTLTRAQVLRAIADSDEVAAAEFNGAFVAAQYYGYLRRTPEAGGYQAWLRVINEDPNNIRIMVNGFLNSTEYRLRFGHIQ